MHLRSSLCALGLGAAFTLLSGCSSTHHAVMGAAPAAPAAVVVAARLNAPDLAFATTAAASGMYEVEAGRLAASRAANAQVKRYGQMLVQHHTLSNNELLALMRARGAAPPAALPPDLQAKLGRLQALSGDAFDREFIRVAGVQDHQTAIALFEQHSRAGGDRDLKAWTDKNLPVLRQHLRSAQDIAGQLAG